MTETTGFVQGADLTWLDISDEEFRVYHYPDGGVYSLYHPLKLNVKRKENGDSHRIQAENGIGHYIAPGWIAISWRVKDGSPTVAF